MSDRAGLRRFIVGGVAALVAMLSAGVAGAAGNKVPEGDQIKKKLERLYNGDIEFSDNTNREKTLVEIEKFLSKDKKNIGMKTPEFWSDAIQEGRFSGTKRKMSKLKDVVSEDIAVRSKDDKTPKPPKMMFYRGGGLVAATKPCPLLVTILERGSDPKAYIEATWPGADDKGAPNEMGKDWVVVAMAVSDDFPADKNPNLLMDPFVEIAKRFPTDSNRWYMEGVGGACDAVQSAASTVLAPRLAGLVLRGPTKAVVNTNSAYFPTLVLHGETSKEGAAVFEAYKKVDDKNNEELKVADLPAVNAFNADAWAWFAKHPLRALPTSYSFATTMTESGDGDPWTGSLWIQSPGKRGLPTKVSVKYVKESNTIDIQCENLGEFYVYMNDDLLNLDNSVAVFVNGTSMCNKKFERNLRSMIELADTVGEYGHVFMQSYRGVVKNAPAPAVAPGAPDPNNPAPGANPPAGTGPQPGGNNPPPADPGKK